MKETSTNTYKEIVIYELNDGYYTCKLPNGKKIFVPELDMAVLIIRNKIEGIGYYIKSVDISLKDYFNV